MENGLNIDVVVDDIEYFHIHSSVVHKDGHVSGALEKFWLDVISSSYSTILVAGLVL